MKHFIAVILILVLCNKQFLLLFSCRKNEIEQTKQSESTTKTLPAFHIVPLVGILPGFVEFKRKSLSNSAANRQRCIKYHFGTASYQTIIIKRRSDLACICAG